MQARLVVGCACFLVIVLLLSACTPAQPQITPQPPPEMSSTVPQPMLTTVLDTPTSQAPETTANRVLVQPPTALPSPTSRPASRVPSYDMGMPALHDLWVDPVNGDDTRDGSSRQQALRTISAAWALIPSEWSGVGFQINLLPGDYPCEGDCINFFADRQGTFDAPLVLRAAEGRGTVTLHGGLNLLHVRYLYLLDLTLWAGREAGAAFGNNVLHIEQADYVLLRGLTLRGPQDCITDECNDMQEVLKVNQAQHVYLEDSELSGAYQTVLDFFSVQYGHIIGNRIHHCGGRGAYVKGGSAHWLIANNEFFDCREAAVQAGEGSNLAFMQPPWLHYESYDVKIVNNVIHDIRGAGLSVAGSYNVLLAYNTLYNVGLDDETGRPWPLLQVIHGARSCVSAEEFGGDEGTHARCQEWLNLDGWGTAALGEDNGGEWIPDRNVYVYNNIFDNPAVGTRYVHFVVNGPIVPPQQAHNIPNPSRTDTNLVIQGNIVWNVLREGASIVGDNNGSGNIGCRSGHATCNESLLQQQNQINVFPPQLADPAQGNFHPVAGGNVFAAKVFAIPDFSWSDAPSAPAVPAGVLSNAVRFDRAGNERTALSPPGAYVR